MDTTRAPHTASQTSTTRVGTPAVGPAAQGATGSAAAQKQGPSSTTPHLAGSRRALVVAPSGHALAVRHAALVRDLVARRHRVLCLSPHLTVADAAMLAALGAETRPWPARESFLRALAERQQASALRSIVADWQPHVALVHGDAATLPAMRAASAARVPRVLALVDGLPQFDARERPDLRRWRRAFEGIHGAVLSNHDDGRTLAAAGVLGRGIAQDIVAGSGVDLDHHAQQPLPGLGDGLVFVMISTLDQRHGLGEFLQAAALVAAQARNARFLLAGPVAGDSGAEAQAITAHAGVVEYLGDVADARPVLARAHVFVYPARPVGMPPPVLEALAAGRPVVTTDTPGCRDTVDERVNGCLVPPGDVAALADAMASFLRRPDLIPAMARAARLKAERRFDVRDATARLGAFMGLR